MFRNTLAAALRNLVRNWLYAGISVLGLAVGMTAAVVTGLYIRDELSFDYFIPGHEKLYVVLQTVPIPGRPDNEFALSPPQTASWLMQEFPGVTAAELCAADGIVPSLRHDDVESQEPVAWVDAAFFELLPLPVVAGDPAAAMASPDRVVITRATAQKFFGRDAPLGELLEINRTIPLRVGAVIEDLPATTSLTHRVFASVVSTAAPQRCAPKQPYPPESILASTRTYVRLRDDAAAATLNRGMPDFVTRNMGFGPEWSAAAGLGGRLPALKLIRLDALHMTPLPQDSGLAQGNAKALLSLGLVAGLTVVIAGINFVNLMIARSTRRMVEVGIRKVSGAARRHLIAQFLGECVIYALMALLITTMMAELVLPAVRPALERPMAFAFWRDPALLGCTIMLSLAVGVLAGAYPALAQSRFRPAVALKGEWFATPGGALVRQALVALQFVILITLIFSVLVIGRQTRFAMNEGLRVDKDQVLMMDVSPVDFSGVTRPRPKLTPQCRGAFVDEVRRLPGVRSAACSSQTALSLDDLGGGCGSAAGPGGQAVSLGCGDVDAGFFELFGLQPVAGRFFSPAFTGDDALRPPSFGGRLIVPQRVVINETAVRALGYSSATDAVGKILKLGQPPEAPEMTVVGVVPDFALNLLHGEMRPAFYGMMTPRFDTLNIKLIGRDIPETMEAIDLLWKRLGEPRAPSHRFIDSYLQAAYAATLRQGLLVDILCGIAIFIAALGLFGLAAFTAERRTKEIGVRKALGASRADILRMLMWEFAKPVLWANAIAWPVGYVVMRRWLEGFTYRIDLEPWMFVSASALALAIAILTVAGHALLVARAEPVTALRYE